MKTKEYTSWETIQKMYPDSFVLLENPVFDGAHLQEAIFLYKHRSRNNVIKKAIELKPYYSTLLYTGGIRGDIAKKYKFVL